LAALPDRVTGFLDIRRHLGVGFDQSESPMTRSMRVPDCHRGLHRLQEGLPAVKVALAPVKTPDKMAASRGNQRQALTLS
jgi:hypothetical protein